MNLPSDKLNMISVLISYELIFHNYFLTVVRGTDPFFFPEFQKWQNIREYTVWTSESTYKITPSRHIWSRPGKTVPVGLFCFPADRGFVSVNQKLQLCFGRGKKKTVLRSELKMNLGHREGILDGKKTVFRIRCVRLYGWGGVVCHSRIIMWAKMGTLRALHGHT